MTPAPDSLIYMLRELGSFGLMAWVVLVLLKQVQDTTQALIRSVTDLAASDREQQQRLDRLEAGPQSPPPFIAQVEARPKADPNR